MQLPEQIHTNRLILKRSSMADVEFYFTCGSNEKVNRYMTWLPPKDLNETKQLMNAFNKNWEEKTAYNYTLFRRSDNERVGTIEPIPQKYKASVGYTIAPDFWGNGYATEALIAIRDKIFENEMIRRFWTVCDTANVASARVMQKSGMELEGILRKWRPSPNISNEPRDVYCYSIVR